MVFNYDGSLRVVEPYTHGTSVAGAEVLRAWQYGGQSSSNNLPVWRLFDVNRMVNAVILDDHVTNLERDISEGDKGMTEIHCTVKEK